MGYTIGRKMDISQSIYSLLTSGGGNTIFELLGKYDIMSRGQAEQITLNPVIYIFIDITIYSIIIIRGWLTLHWFCDVMMMCFVSKFP